MRRKKADKEDGGTNRAEGLAVPGIPRSACGPTVMYDDPCSGNDLPVTGIYFYGLDGEHPGNGRVTFYNLDAIRVCRGEYMPYQTDWDRKSPGCWVYEVRNSTWLAERFEYESAFYGFDYEWGGDVREMLTDFQHYVFTFDDQFVEAIAGGIWFEESGESEASLKERGLTEGHPAHGIPEDAPCESFHAHGLECKVRTSPLSRDELIERSRLYPQTLAEFHFQMGDPHADFFIQIRRREGRVVSLVSHWLLGKYTTVFEGCIDPAQARETVEAYMASIQENRREMGLE